MGSLTIFAPREIIGMLTFRPFLPQPPSKGGESVDFQSFISPFGGRAGQFYKSSICLTFKKLKS